MFVVSRTPFCYRYRKTIESPCTQGGMGLALQPLLPLLVGLVCLWLGGFCDSESPAGDRALSYYQ